MRTFIYFHPGALGDFILTWPALIALDRILQNHRRIGVGRADAMRLALSLGLIDEFVDAESRECIGFFSGLSLPPAAAEPDGAVLWLKNGDEIAARIRETSSLPVVLLDPLPPGKIHVGRRHLESVSAAFAVGLPDDPTAGFPKHRARIRRIYIHPGSGGREKTGPPDLYRKIAAILRQSGWEDVRFIMGPVEIDRGLDRAFSGEPMITPEDPVRLADCLREASGYIGNDSGVSHLAAFLGLPSVVLYKTTDPDVWGAVGKNVACIRMNPDADLAASEAVRALDQMLLFPGNEAV